MFAEMMSVEGCSNKSKRRAEANTAVFKEFFALAAEMGVTPLDEQMDIEELITRNGTKITVRCRTLRCYSNTIQS